MHLQIKKVIALLLLSVPASADTVIKYGVGLTNSAKKSIAETKVLSVAYQNKVIGPIIYQLEGGAWLDNRADLGRSGSGFADAGVGFHVQNEGAYCQTSSGVAVITDTDRILGGHLQFNHDFACGLKDSDDNTLGINFKHLSSAGISSPNLGRDFLMIRLSVPW